MYKLFLFFYNLNVAMTESSDSTRDMVAKKLRFLKTRDLLALRDDAYALCNAINDELVRDEREEGGPAPRFNPDTDPRINPDGPAEYSRDVHRGEGAR